MLDTTNQDVQHTAFAHPSNGPDWMLEQLGRISFQCLTDRQNGKHETIEYYINANPHVSPELVRTVLEPTLLLYSVATTKPPISV